jgi:tetratricopeptide (TPR) repeat protein
MTKQRRNELCACGSGKKHKNCCLQKDEASRDTGLADLFRREGLRSLDHDRAVRDDAELQLERLLRDPRATDDDRLNTSLALVGTAQRRGDHRGALRRLDALAVPEESDAYIQVLSHRATSLTQLGSYQEAAELMDTLLARLKATKSIASGWWELEAGRTYHLAGRYDDAVRVTKRAIAFFKKNKNEIEHLTRAETNLAIFRLASDKPDEVELAEHELEQKCDIKIAIGDYEGASTNFSQLSMHHFSKGRFEKAIAYARKDLKLARLVGDDRNVASTLGNMAFMYLSFLQLSEARNFCREAAAIGDRLNNPDIINKMAILAGEVEKVGRQAGEQKIAIGKNADCACGSGKKYVDCCGRADHEPVALRTPVGGFSEDIDDIRAAVKASGFEPARLDYAMRETEKSRQRVSWTQTRGHDGWFEMFELPDMANIHLNAAQAFADLASKDPDAINEPIACAMLAVSALEAFINSTIYFACEAAKQRTIALPSELTADPYAYQRYTELTQKWSEVGTALSTSWPPPAAIWTRFVKLVKLRNELVHYKAEGFARVVPPEKMPHEHLRDLPPDMVRDIPHSWPVRLLTPSFARWAVSVADDLMHHFRSSYRFAPSATKAADER